MQFPTQRAQCILPLRHSAQARLLLYWYISRSLAQVRELKNSSESLVLLKTNMAAGHFADSGLEGKLKEMAFK